MRVRTTVLMVGVVLACATPSILVNIWPTLSAVLAGTAASDAPIWITLQGTSVLLMAACPVVLLERGFHVGARAAAAVLGVVLLAFNLSSAVTIAAHRQEDRTEHNRGAMQDAAGITADLEAAIASRRALPSFTPASAGSVMAAQTAVKTARDNRDAECKKRGDQCKARETDDTAAVAALADAENRKTLTDEARRIDTTIAELRSQQRKAGAAPKSEDGAAERGGAFLALLGVPMGPNPAAVWGQWYPVFVAFVFELVALLGPVVVLAILTRPDPLSRPVEVVRYEKIQPIAENQLLEIDTTVPALVAPATVAATLAEVDRDSSATLAEVDATVAEVSRETVAVDWPEMPQKIFTATVDTPTIEAPATVRDTFATVREALHSRDFRPAPLIAATPCATPPATVRDTPCDTLETVAVNNVSEWRAAATVSKQGARWPAGAAHKHYSEWCNASNLPADNITGFGIAMAEMGVEKERTPGNRVYYLGIAPRLERVAVHG